MNPEHLERYYLDNWSASDSGQGDGNTYWPDSDGYEMLHFRRFSITGIDTPGATGTNNYAIQASQDRSNWFNVNNSWFGVGTYTTHFFMHTTFDVAVKYIRLIRARSGDGGSNDGGSVIAAYFKR